jgi:hypothetical protein
MVNICYGDGSGALLCVHSKYLGRITKCSMREFLELRVIEKWLRFRVHGDDLLTTYKWASIFNLINFGIFFLLFSQLIWYMSLGSLCIVQLGSKDKSH